VEILSNQFGRAVGLMGEVKGAMDVETVGMHLF